MNFVTLRVSAVIAALVQAFPGWASHALTIFAVPMYLGGEEILSTEYEYEPDLGSCLGVHNPRFARLSTESSRAHRTVAAAGAEIYPSYAALEQFQSGEFAQLQHELRYQKAQASPTASNIQVALGSQVTKLHDRVAALEKPAHVASSSSASHQG
ncbi:hypothetical protein PC114_g6535 [Phytophthora cactorum]|nr:hypothetical protein PC114_g6535 [Phytophthora cactorum]KAG3181032.1 hypothetical protein C6341_g6602 [Phytophthora cactorum]